jgi:RNA polymerase sigma-70 factor (ECF subfamily)
MNSAPDHHEVEEAIRQVQMGSIEDYRTVVLAYRRRLRLAAAGFCPPGVDLEEIVHLTFLEAFRRIGEYRLGTNFFAWLSAFARNLVLAECEKIRRQARNRQNYFEHRLAEQLAASGVSVAVDEVRSRFLGECLELLKKEARELIRWRYEEGLRVQGIAQRLGRSAAAVSVQMFGLRKLLRDCVTKRIASGQSF